MAGDLELTEDPRHERRAYRTRVVAAVAGALLLTAALLGLLGGDGPLADARETSDDGAISVRYERFLHWRSPAEVVVRLGTGEQNTNVAFSRDYLESFEVQSISAEPESVATLGDRTVYTFEVEPGAELTFSVEPQRIGRREGIVYGPGGSSLSFVQWVYP